MLKIKRLSVRVLALFTVLAVLAVLPASSAFAGDDIPSKPISNDAIALAEALRTNLAAQQAIIDREAEASADEHAKSLNATAAQLKLDNAQNSHDAAVDDKASADAALVSANELIAELDAQKTVQDAYAAAGKAYQAARAAEEAASAALDEAITQDTEAAAKYEELTQEKEILDESLVNANASLDLLSAELETLKKAETPDTAAIRAKESDIVSATDSANTIAQQITAQGEQVSAAKAKADSAAAALSAAKSAEDDALSALQAADAKLVAAEQKANGVQLSSEEITKELAAAEENRLLAVAAADAMAIGVTDAAQALDSAKTALDEANAAYELAAAELEAARADLDSLNARLADIGARPQGIITSEILAAKEVAPDLLIIYAQSPRIYLIQNGETVFFDTLIRNANVGIDITRNAMGYMSIRYVDLFSVTHLRRLGGDRTVMFIGNYEKLTIESTVRKNTFILGKSAEIGELFIHKNQKVINLGVEEK
ncbi:MAG: hypothetical protein LBD16_05525 [Oscillospiraceae bacterium]|jgi:chromosome segregation ATPase|nr:hypothetical protein [Oscillospiraceae bacterium]